MNTKNKILLTTAINLCIVGLVLATDTSPKPAAKASQIARGAYLIKFGDCSACHTPLKFGEHGPEPDTTKFLSGHPAGTKLPPPDMKPGPWFASTAGMTAWAGPWGISYAANLTPSTNTGIGIWTEDMFIKAMRTGRHMGSGRPILPPMPWEASRALTDDDLKAVFAYLKSLPPIENMVPAPLGTDGKLMFPE